MSTARTTKKARALTAAAVGVGDAPKIAQSSAIRKPAWIYTKAGRWRACHSCASTSKSKVARAPPHIFLATDLDCTLTMDDCTLARHAVEGHGAVDADTARFNRRWLSMREEHDRCVLCYSTGRSLAVFEALVAEQRARTAATFPDGALLLPDVLITSDGTEIHWREDDGTLSRDAGWDAMLRTDWNAERVRRIFEEDPMVAAHGVDLEVWFDRIEEFRVSVVVEGEEGARVSEDSIRGAIEKCHGLVAHVFTCTHTGGAPKSSPQFWLVATSKSGGKGCALDYVRERVGAVAERTLVAGDSGNDVPMFDRAARGGVRGVVVGNAHSELVEFAQQFEGHLFAEQRCAAAITYALDEFDF